MDRIAIHRSLSDRVGRRGRGRPGHRPRIRGSLRGLDRQRSRSRDGLTTLLGSALLAAALLGCDRAGPPPQASTATAAVERPVSPPLLRLIEEQRAAITKNRRDAGAHGRLGMIYEANEWWGHAVPAYETAARLDPDTPEWSFHASLCRSEAGELERLLPELEELTRRFPDFAPAFHVLGRLHLEAGEVDAAVRAFSRARDLRPTVAEPLIALAQVALLQGDGGTALTLAEKAVGLAPRSAHARYARGRALRAVGREEEAAPDLALEVNGPLGRPRDTIDARIAPLAVGVSTAIDRGADLIDAGRPEDAIRHFRAALQDFPGNHGLRTNLAVALLNTGKVQEARTELEALARETPGDLGVLLNLAEALWQLRDHERGLAVTAELIESHPEKGLAQYARARAEYAVGNVDGGIEASRRAIEAEPRNALFLSGLAEGYVAKKDAASAADVFAQAVALEPTNLAYRANLCALLLHLGKAEEARPHLDECRRMAPHDRRVQALAERYAAATSRP